MRVSRTYGGNHFKGEEMDAKPILLTIDEVSSKEFDGKDGKASQEKIILAFRETDTTMIVNFTNANIIAGFLGDETDDWIGEQIVLFRDKTRYGNKMVPCVSVRQARAAADTKPVRRREKPVPSTIVPMTQDEADESDPAADDDDIPF